MKPSGLAACNRVLSVTEDTDVYRAQVPVRSKGHRLTDPIRTVHIYTAPLMRILILIYMLIRDSKNIQAQACCPWYTRHRMPYVK